MKYLGLLLFFSSHVALAQVTVSGVVKDRESGKPLPYVNIIINALPDRTSVTGTITNAGAINLTENYSLTDTDSDGDLDGGFASVGSIGRYGIWVDAGGFTGNITNSNITIEGNDSAGIRIDGRMTGDLTSTGLIAAFAVFFAINIVANQGLRDARIDLTDAQLYTLSDGTRNVIKAVPEPITLRFFFSEKLAGAAPHRGRRRGRSSGADHRRRERRAQRAYRAPR